MNTTRVPIVAALSTRRGTRDHNCDAADLYQGEDGTITAAVVDGTGNTGELAELTDAMALVVARVGHRRGGLAALLTAADLIHDTYDAAVVVVQVDPDARVHTYWIGDCRAWWWTGDELRQLTTDHTMGQLLRVSGGQAAASVAATHDHWLRLGLAEATPATVAEVRGLAVDTATLASGQLVLLTTDGIHAQVQHDHLVDLIRTHGGDVQRLADQLVAAAQPDPKGYRDDATAIVIRRLAR
jgi:protein phosphatase